MVNKQKLFRDGMYEHKMVFRVHCIVSCNLSVSCDEENEISHKIQLLCQSLSQIHYYKTTDIQLLNHRNSLSVFMFTDFPPLKVVSFYTLNSLLEIFSLMRNMKYHRVHSIPIDKVLPQKPLKRVVKFKK